ncbi:MAG: pyridoxamine 5'-phosphate oxidase family protein [Spirochaetaceae bacterium]|nr:pyridoxamine 5'-phosphate oxidase family protein [Spirochaetaceae bacterium]
MNEKILEKANNVIKNCTTASVGVIDENGFPSVSTVSLVRPDNVTELYFTTNIGANKEKRLQKNNKASICCYTKSDNITLVGEAEVLTDQASKDKYWLDWFKDIYGDKTAPDYCVIKFTTKRVSLWVDNEIAEFSL